MSILLQLNTSIYSSEGQSSRLADCFVAAWRKRDPGVVVTVRDLALNPVPHLDARRFRSFLAKPEERDAEQRAVVDYADALLAEIRQADAIVLGLPMYNYGVPSTLKAYFDHIARAGVTFRYAENGPVGLLADKKVYVIATRGGLYAGTARDTQSSYVRDFFRLIGITEVEFVYAEGLNISEASRRNALTQAHSAIEQMSARACTTLFG